MEGSSAWFHSFFYTNFARKYLRRTNYVPTQIQKDQLQKNLEKIEIRFPNP